MLFLMKQSNKEMDKIIVEPRHDAKYAEYTEYACVAAHML